MYKSEIKKLKTDGETTSTKLKAELNSVMLERDSTNQKVSQYIENLNKIFSHLNTA